MSCKCIFNPPPENIEGTVSKQGKLYTRLSRNLIFLHRRRYIKGQIVWMGVLIGTAALIFPLFSILRK